MATSVAETPISSDIVFLLEVVFAFGVPTRLIGASNDFLGLPFAFLPGAGDELGPLFKGTVVVVVCCASRFTGEPGSASSGSASTVTRIRHGLAMFSVCVIDFVGEEENRGA